MPVWAYCINIGTELIQSPRDSQESSAGWSFDTQTGTGGSDEGQWAITTTLLCFLQVKEFHPFIACWIILCPFNKIVINNSLSSVSEDPYMNDCVALYWGISNLPTATAPKKNCPLFPLLAINCQ